MFLSLCESVAHRCFSFVILELYVINETFLLFLELKEEKEKKKTGKQINLTCVVHGIQWMSKEQIYGHV